MKTLTLGQGFKTIQSDPVSTSVVTVDTSKVMTENTVKYKSARKLIQSSYSSLRELSSLLNLSVNVGNIAPELQAGFSQELRSSGVNSYLVLTFTEITHTKQLVPDSYSANQNAVDQLDENLPLFYKVNGDKFVKSISYGRELTAVIQLKDQIFVNESTVDLKAKVKTDFVEASSEFHSLLQQIDNSQVANIFYYVSGSKNPQFTLTKNINDLYGVLDLLKTKAKSEVETEKEKSKRKAEAKKAAAEKDKADKAKEKESKSEQAKTEQAKAESSKTEQLKKEEPKVEPAKADQDKPDQDKPKGAEADKSADKPKIEAIDKTDADNPVELIADPVQVDYEVESYEVAFKTNSAVNLQQKIIVDRKILDKVAECHRLLTGYNQLIEYALNNQNLLKTTSNDLSELNETREVILNYIYQLQDMASEITHVPFMDNQVLKEKVNNLNSLIEGINLLKTNLVHLNDATFLVAEFPAHYSKNFSGEKHSHRASHYKNMSFPPHAKNLEFELFNMDAGKEVYAEGIEFKIKKRRPVMGKVLHQKLESGKSVVPLANEAYQSVYVADLKKVQNNVNAENFMVRVYAKTGSSFQPISKLIFENLQRLNENQSGPDFSASAAKNKTLLNGKQSVSSFFSSAAKTKKLLMGTFKGEIIAFDELIAKGDGSCGFYVLPTKDRNAVSRCLLSLTGSEDAREYLAVEIAELLLSDGHEQEDLLATFNEADQAKCKKLLDQINAASSSSQEEVDEANEALITFCQLKSVYEAYVGEKGLGNKLWLGSRSAIVYCAANNINIYVWTKDENGRLKLEDKCEEFNSVNTVHMLLTDGYTHFNLLVEQNVARKQAANATAAEQPPALKP